MYMVYWTQFETGEEVACAQKFDSNAMTAALRFMEELRHKQRSGTALGFITMCSENPDSVGHPGVAETGPDYHWKKRRP